MNKEIISENREYALHKIKTAENRAKEILLDLERCRSYIERERDEDSFKKLSELLTKIEKLYTGTKTLSLYEKAITEKEMVISERDLIEAFSSYGGSSWLKENPFGGYTLRLPNLASKNYKLKKSGDSKAVMYLILYLIRHYTDETEFREIRDPVLIFEHHIDDNKLMHYADSDNMDVKRVTDTIQGFLIEDDSLLSLAIFHFGVKDSDNFCDVSIIPRAKFEAFISAKRDIFNA